MKKYLGIDIGAETVKVVEIVRDQQGLRWTGRRKEDHGKNPLRCLREMLGDDWEREVDAAVTGRLGREIALPRVPSRQARAAAHRFLSGDEPATLISIGSHGFSVLELRAEGNEVYRENSRCSQGTGNFLRQLVERFGLETEEADRLCSEVENPAPLSGRCPVILKTDMTHLANKGESHSRILAGLFDAVCENVQVLIKPLLSPPDVILLGGVSQSERARKTFEEFLSRNGMRLKPTSSDDALYYDALGAALTVEDGSSSVVSLPRPKGAGAAFERIPALSSYLSSVRRMPRLPEPEDVSKGGDLILGFDIGSTGSKLVALDTSTREPIWEGYGRTSGDPVGAAQSLLRRFVDGPAGGRPVTAVGATGSGREIVGSLLASCYGARPVFILNEIAAHAEGALHFDSRVDTIFEIGGQDAKYIRLADGKVIDAAMNEACSAGTGSFIEEQGRRFEGVKSVQELNEEALSAKDGVSLGQHCSVFMAEIIDEAVAAGVERASIIAGIYDSIVQNYLNRVKGSRSVGEVIFCQGMPFSSDALAAAVARQTGSEVIIPPNPGTTGALGIALLSLKEQVSSAEPVDLQRFLAAKIESRDTFVCRSKKGCGGSGNHCRIDRISTVVEDSSNRFTWGGGCSLWDKGTRRRKLPDLAPDPFRERAALVERIVEEVSRPRGRPVIGISDEFQLKGLFPFFATYLRECGFDLSVKTRADGSLLKHGIELANVPFCAPMQLMHGVAGAFSEERIDWLFLPMLLSIPRTRDEGVATTCPIVQGSPDLIKSDLGPLAPRILSPVIDIGVEGLDSLEFKRSCEKLARSLRVPPMIRRRAFDLAKQAQGAFDEGCIRSGNRALRFCEENEITPVVVLGRSYTIHNTVLNSNVPAILREQGSIAIPVDCYEIDETVPVLENIYWGYSQRNLRAAHQVRRSSGTYAIYCSNYSCGPDSFTLHFFAWSMEGRPFAVIETDGHSGDAGTRTRVEAFLHCVKEDLSGRARRSPRDSRLFKRRKETVPDIRRRGEVVLVPRMGPGSEAVAACMRATGLKAEALPLADRDTVRVGRRYTSGKECLPMMLTLGSLLQRLESEQNERERFAFIMPTTVRGPCRFGVYNLLHKIVLERLGWRNRVRVWSPSDAGYFEGVPGGMSALTFTGLVASDLLLEGLYDARPAERWPGAAEDIHRRKMQELAQLLEGGGGTDLSLPAALGQVASRDLFGCAELLRQAAAEYSVVREDRDMPTVLLVGEIYVRCDEFSNDWVVNKLEQRGIRARFAPFNEWLEYTEHCNRLDTSVAAFGAQVSRFIQTLIRATLYDAMGKCMGWPNRTTVRDALGAAADYLRDDLRGEAVLTLGGPVHEWRHGHIDGVVSVGPLECMPNKLSEAHFFHVAEREGLRSLTLSLNGDPIDPEILDSFAFEVHADWRRRKEMREDPRRGRGLRPRVSPDDRMSPGRSVVA